MFSNVFGSATKEEEKQAESCERCGVKFTFFKRRHHCRICMKTVCATCSDYKIIVPKISVSTPSRVCFVCKEDAESKTNEKTEPIAPSSYQESIISPASNVFQFKFQYTGDTNGVIYHIGGSNTKVTSSGVAKGQLEDFLSRERSWCWTKNEPNSWFCVDLGANRAMHITHYTIGYGSGGTYAFPRHWKLQGTNNYTESRDPNDPNWFTIKTHTNDSSFHTEHQRVTFPVSVGQPFRYFRIIQTGKNSFKASANLDNFSNVLVLSGFDMYGTLYTSSFASNAVSKKSAPYQEYKFRSNHDKNGVIYTHRSDIRVTCSRILKGKPEDFIERGKIHCWTSNEPFSWYCVDLGPNKALVPNYYTFQYGSSGNYACPRNWLIQGSNTYNMSRDLEDPNWITLRNHTSDESIDSEYGIKSWPVTTIQAFRYFRIIQTGKNSYKVPVNTTDGWSDVFVASGFEIYGTLYDLDFSMCPCVHYPFTDTLEANGIIYHLGQQVGVTASSIGTGTARGFISRDKTCNWTMNIPNSWFSVDLGTNKFVWPTHYSVGYASGGNLCVPRNWKLQATNNIGQAGDTGEANWDTLREHVNDTTLNFDYEIATWEVKAAKAYRYFRAIQSGPNAYSPNTEEADGWSQVLAINGFELYGTLYSGEPPKDLGNDTQKRRFSTPNDMNLLNSAAETVNLLNSPAAAEGEYGNIFDVMPKEIMMLVFTYLDGESLCSASLVSQRWKKVSDENTIWRGLCMREWRAIAPHFFNSDRNWKTTWLGSKLLPFSRKSEQEDADNSLLGEEDTTTLSYTGQPIGLLHAIWKNCPETFFRVASSGAQKGFPHEFLSRENTFCWTTNKKSSWYRVDLGKHVKIVPVCYTFKYGSSANYCVPRYWRFQASNDERVESSPDDETLKVNQAKSEFIEVSLS